MIDGYYHIHGYYMKKEKKLVKKKQTMYCIKWSKISTVQ